MATSLLTSGDPEEIISCPYNKAHQIIRKRMQFHLVKCKKNYPDTNLQECIYNSVHKIPEPEMKFHLENCPDRHKLDRFYFKKEDRESSNSFNRFPIQNIKVETEECWDNVCVPTYDPVKKCENAPVLRQLNVESAAKRRDFRYAERQRLQNLAEVKTERKPGPEKAAEYAQRLQAIRATTSRVTTDVEEDDPFEVATLTERIRMGNIPVLPMKLPKEESDTDNTISDAEMWQVSSDKSKKGFGRGKFIKKANPY